MAGKNKKKKGIAGNVAAQNRKARHDFAIEETFEAGLQLTGTEVKSLRQGRCSINEAYAAEKQGELWLINSHIPEYQNADPRFNHAPKRDRKILVHKKQLASLIGATQQKGMTLVPLKIYFNDRGIAKLELALAKGKSKIDKRQDIKDRDWKRDKARILRERG